MNGTKKSKVSTKYNVISIRVTDVEKKAIDALTQSCKVNPNNFLRELLFGSGLLFKG